MYFSVLLLSPAYSLKLNNFSFSLMFLAGFALYLSPLSSVRDALAAVYNSDRQDPELLPLTLISLLNTQIVVSTTMIIQRLCVHQAKVLYVQNTTNAF